MHNAIILLYIFQDEFFFIRQERLISIWFHPSLKTVFTPHAGPSAAYPEAMGYMMDGQAHMMQRPPGDPGFHQGYAHYPPAEYYGHHL